MFEPAIDHFGNSVKFQPLHLPPASRRWRLFDCVQPCRYHLSKNGALALAIHTLTLLASRRVWQWATVPEQN